MVAGVDVHVTFYFPVVFIFVLDSDELSVLKQNVSLFFVVVAGWRGL